MAEKYYCDICGIELINYEPLKCCNGFDCGCMGQPTNPPICSEKCWDKAMNKKKG